MNQLGFTVAVIGNHEFDIPLEKLKTQIDHSRFRWISANTYLNQPGKGKKHLVSPTATVAVGGVSIGILGLTTQSTEKIGNPKHLKNIQFTSILEETKKFLPKLKKSHDMVVALTHLGHYPSETKEPMPYPGDVSLAKTFPQLDLILGGHSHTLVLGELVNNVPIYQAECYNRYAIRVDFEVNKGQKPKRISHSLIKLNSYPNSWEELQKVEHHLTGYQYIETIINNALQITESIFSQVIAESTGDFYHDRKDLFRRSVPIGNLLADSQRDFTKADIAIVNAGGIRAGLAKGTISMRDILLIAPFNNTIGIVELSGKELEAFFAELLSRAPDGHFPQISGMEVHFNRDSGQVRLYLPQGRVMPERRYQVAMNSYSAGGGNSYPNYLAQNNFRDLGRSDAEILADYLRKLKRVDPLEYQAKRIRFFRYRKP